MALQTTGRPSDGQRQGPHSLRPACARAVTAWTLKRVDFPFTGALIASSKDIHFGALELSWTAGWLLLIVVTGLALFFVAQRDAFRRLVMRAEDPRPLGMFRILFGTCALMNILEMWENYRFLFTNEGIFPTAVARHVRARRQFAGFGDGIVEQDPTGFFDFSAFVQWLEGSNYSLLLFWDSPTAFWIIWGVFVVSMVMLIVGFQTRWVKWVAWFLFHTIIMRNALFWEGTENVYRTLFFYLCLSRCGRAYSVDNWLRCRKLRKQGRLSERGGPGDGAGLRPDDQHPKGLEPIFALVPFWPRLLVMLQVATIYTDTGILKNGPIWHRGDAFYYAFNLDHFYRFPPQQLSAWLGTTLFRANTIITHYWEACFPLVVLGLILRWVVREQPTPPARWRVWLGRIGLLSSVVAFWAMVWWLYPVHYSPKKGDISLTAARWLVCGGAALAFTLLVVGYNWLRFSPPTVKLRGKSYVLDLDWFCRWFFGRRLWLSVGLIFHAHLVLLMNIGWFTPALVASYVVFLNGEELSRIGATLFRAARRIVPAIPEQWGQPIPRSNYDLPVHKRDNITLPMGALLASVGVAILGVVRHMQTGPGMWEGVMHAAKKHFKTWTPPEWWPTDVPEAHWGWFALFIVLYLSTVTIRRVRGYATHAWAHVAFFGVAWIASLAHARELLPMRWGAVAVVLVAWVGSLNTEVEDKDELPRVDPTTGRPTPPWAHGPIGRVLATSLIAWHCLAVGAWLLPDKFSLDSFRSETRSVFKDWLRLTQTSQGWAMFAPNPPRSNMFMRVIVTDAEGEVFDMNTDVYACFQEHATEEICDAVYPIPWIFYDRHRKMMRRIAGSEGGNGVWYQKWYGRYVCREWQRSHEGELPEKVQLIKVSYPMPSPDWVWEHGPYDPKQQFHDKGNEKFIHTTRCAREVEAQLDNETRRELGFPEVDEREIKTFRRRLCKRWENKRIKAAKDRGEEVDPEDPRFSVCLEVEDEDGDDDKSKASPAKVKAVKARAITPPAAPVRNGRPNPAVTPAPPSPGGGKAIKPRPNNPEKHPRAQTSTE